MESKEDNARLFSLQVYLYYYIILVPVLRLPKTATRGGISGQTRFSFELPCLKGTKHALLIFVGRLLNRSRQRSQMVGNGLVGICYMISIFYCVP